MKLKIVKTINYKNNKQQQIRETNKITILF